VSEAEARFDLGDYRVVIATAFGPRLLAFDHRLGRGPLVRLDDRVALDGGPDGPYRMRGGHRLWAAPELPEVTYATDDEPCEVVEEPGGVTVGGPTDAAGLRKTIRLRAAEDAVVVEHELSNAGPSAARVAAWAITQVRLGGIAMCPLLGNGNGGLQADRSLVLWPYTDPSDQRITYRPDGVSIEAAPGPALKLGAGPRPGALGYLLDGRLFTKTVAGEQPDAEYPDRGAVGQIYLNERFCELESVGPLTDLGPGESITHTEVWQLQPCEDPDTAHRLVIAEARR
jgi:hypothetical protein